MLLLRKIYFPFLLISLAIAACKHPQTEQPLPKNIPSNIDSGNCDTQNVTYSVTIKKVLTANCMRCHGNNVFYYAGGGYNFDDYTVIYTHAINGNLAKAINHAPGSVPMPTDIYAKISDCSIRKFMIWIASGAPNN